MGEQGGIVGGERAKAFADKLERLAVSRETMSALDPDPQ